MPLEILHCSAPCRNVPVTFTLDRMGTAASIKSLRLNSGRSEQELAEILGITIHAYGDLEAYDDELFTCLSLADAQRLMRVLGTGLGSFVGTGENPGLKFSLTEAPAALRRIADERRCTLDELSDEVGWELDDFMQSPERTAGERPVSFLQDLAAVLQIDWPRLLPPDHESHPPRADAV